MYFLKHLSNSKIEIKFEIPKEEFEKIWNQAEKNIAKTLNIKGFRQGNVPKEIAKQYINENDILNEAAKLTIYDNLNKTVEKENLEIIHTPEIQIIKIAKSNPFEFKVVCDIVPKFELTNYKKIKIKKQEINISDLEINSTLNELQNMRAKVRKIERPAKFNDIVNIDYKISIDGKIIKNGEGKNAEFILGQGQLIEGLEKNIENMNVNEEKKFTLTIPNSFYQKEIAGKLVDIEIKLNEVKERILPEINDEFAKSLGNFDNLEILKNSIKEGIIIEKEKKEQERIRLEILNTLIKNIKIELPECLINEEAEKLSIEFKNNIKSITNMEFKDYLTRIKKSENELMEGFKKEAEKRIKSYLIFKQIAKIENIAPTEEEIIQKAEELLKQFSSVREAQEKIDIEQLLDYSRNVLLNEKIFEYLESIMVV